MQHLKSPLGNISVETFLAEYWQKKPLLIRQAFADFQSPLTPDELAGLACEADVNSRIVIEKGGEEPWQAIHGPMDESVFTRLPDTHWSLVVNDLEKYLPELAEITDQFRFIPEWYLDDLMSSYAAPEGSVGPHIDLYDVFILQGSGQRRWQICTRPVAEDNVIPNIALRLQKEFVAEQEWTLELGDMMYLPAGVSHHGVSLGESMSYSIGFRSTSHTDLLSDFIAHITRDLSINETYHLPAQPRQAHANEITPAAVQQIREIFSRYLDPDHHELSRWFGRYVSDPRIDYVVENEDLVESFEQLYQLNLQRHPASGFAFIREGTTTRLFIDGEDYVVSSGFAEQLCKNRSIDFHKLAGVCSQQERKLVLALYNSGKIYHTPV
jgi:50S ribosomal protein L16 3-hydroxylase